MDLAEIHGLFAKAAKIDPSKKMTLEQLEWDLAEDGAKRFRRQVLGWFPFGTKDLSIDQVAEQLTKAGMVPTVEEGRALVPRLYGVDISFGLGTLYFEEVLNRAGIEFCRVGAVYYGTQRDGHPA